MFSKVVHGFEILSIQQISDINYKEERDSYKYASSILNDKTQIAYNNVDKPLQKKYKNN